MAYSQPHIRFSFGGTQADGLEIWSASHAIDRTGDLSLDPKLWFNDVTVGISDLGALVQTFIGDSAARVPNNSKIKWCKMALIGTDGKYMGAPVVHELDWGGAINAPYSPQDAMVVTLISSVWRGAGRYNRFYLPTAGPAGSNAWCLSTAEQTAFLTAATTYVDDVNDFLATELGLTSTRVSVVSNTGTGSSRPAEEIMVGRIVDTQRRRRNALTEDYVTSEIGTTP